MRLITATILVLCVLGTSVAIARSMDPVATVTFSPCGSSTAIDTVPKLADRTLVNVARTPVNEG